MKQEAARYIIQELKPQTEREPLVINKRSLDSIFLASLLPYFFASGLFILAAFLTTLEIRA